MCVSLERDRIITLFGIQYCIVSIEWLDIKSEKVFYRKVCLCVKERERELRTSLVHGQIKAEKEKLY